MRSEQSLRQIVDALYAGSLSAHDLYGEAAARHAATESVLGAYKTWTPEHAAAQARNADALAAEGTHLGPLQGIPISIKDVYGVTDLPIFAGSKMELPAAWRREGPIVAALRRQIAVFTGKTHAVEFAFGGLGINGHWGAPRNPWDAAQHRVSGGSSSGAGVSLCQGSALLALGTDTAGSVRIPASWTGTAGLKISKGRWPTDGIVPLSRLFDTAGLLARSVDDLALGAAAIEAMLGGRTCHPGRPPRPPDLAGLAIGIPDHLLWQDCDPGIAETAKSALDEIARAGAKIVALSCPEATAAHAIFQQGGTAAAELYAFLREELPDWLDCLDPSTASRMEAGRQLSAADFLSRQARLETLGRAAASRFDMVDIIACPTVPISPPLVEEVASAESYRKHNMASLRNTCVANFLGLCALSLPVGLDALGLPVGLQFMAAHGRDRALLAIGCAVEGVIGNARQRLGRPPLGSQ